MNKIYIRLIKTGSKQSSAWAAITHLSTKMAGFARRSLLRIKSSGLVAICSPEQKHNKLIFLSSKMSFIRPIRRKDGLPKRAIIITAKLIYFTTQTFFFVYAVLEFYKECQIFDKNTTLTLISVKLWYEINPAEHTQWWIKMAGIARWSSENSILWISCNLLNQGLVNGCNR